MTRRRLLLFGLLATVIGLGAGGWMACPQHTTAIAITRENAAKIQEGMTLSEVEAILGGPARDERTGSVQTDGAFEQMQSGNHEFSRQQKLETWDSDSVSIWATFNSDDCVIGCVFLPMRRRSESPLDMVRRWLHL